MNAPASNQYVLGHSELELERLCAQGRWLGELTEQLPQAMSCILVARLVGLLVGAWARVGS